MQIVTEAGAGYFGTKVHFMQSKTIACRSAMCLVSGN